MSPIIQPLMEHIEDSTQKWRVAPSEYEKLKENYTKNHNDSLEGYDNWFNSKFIILTPEEIELREERIFLREKGLKRIQELREQKAKIDSELDYLTKECDLLLKKINWEDD